MAVSQEKSERDMKPGGHEIEPSSSSSSSSEQQEEDMAEEEEEEEEEEAAIAREDWFEVAAEGDERLDSDGDGDLVRPDGAYYAKLNLVILLLWLAYSKEDDDSNLGESEPKFPKQDETEDHKMIKSKNKAKARTRQANDFKLLRRTHQRCQPTPKDLRHCRKM